MFNKMILAFAFSVISLNVFAQNAVAQSMIVKSCSANLKMLDSDDAVPMKIEVIANGDIDDNHLKAKVTQTIKGKTSSYITTVSMADHNIRGDLLSIINNPPADLNEGERLVLHASMLTTDPLFQGSFSTGVDLSLVKKTKVYLIGERAEMGIFALVEARGVNSKLLGSFIGGFLVGACQ